MAKSSSTSPSSPRKPGVAGRTNYAAWDKLTRDLVTTTEAEAAAEAADAQQALGHDKVPVSQAHADELAKAKTVKETKKKLEKFQQREASLGQTFEGLLGPVPSSEEKDESQPSSTSSSSPRVVRITRDRVEAGKRVLTFCDTSGSPIDPAAKKKNSKLDTIVLTQDLSHLESKMAANAMAPTRSYADDAENSVQPEESQEKKQRSIFGLIKVFVSNVHNCQLIIKCKLISGTVELHNCSNVTVIVEKTATVATIQADLSSNLTIEFHDAPSGQHNPAVLAESKKLYWGDDKDDRIFHAGVANMCVRLIRDGCIDQEHTADYIKDGAISMGNSTAAEYQFITSVVDGTLTTEAVARNMTGGAAGGGSTRNQARAMTQRELQQAEEKRAAAAKRAVALAEDMIQIRDKDGNVLATKTKKDDDQVDKQEEPVLEEVYTTMSKAEVDAIVAECQENKTAGNTAFSAGEYGQAILLYTLALDKADELPDQPTKDAPSLFPRDVVFSNRAACFLKLGQHEKAEQDALKAVELNPENIKAWFRRGLALHADSKYEEALPCLAKAHKMEPKNKQIKQALQFCEVRLEQDRRKRMEG